MSERAHTYPPLHTFILVGIGAMVGVAARALLGEVWPPQNHVAYTTVGINLLGAFLLGLLTDRLAARGPETPRIRDVRLLLGTGVIGGFTTFSAIAMDTVTLLHLDRITDALIYALISMLGGVLTAWLGMILGAKFLRGRTR
ncbi:fluoride efflux transporter FluC [Mycetocola saprophilus]|uniref:fluoride efflux transporter FluC n=1 Tax=Mycetocola saprophilus TaxID=76636 RepID=UPI003BF2CF74